MRYSASVLPPPRGTTSRSNTSSRQNTFHRPSRPPPSCSSRSSPLFEKCGSTSKYRRRRESVQNEISPIIPGYQTRHASSKSQSDICFSYLQRFCIANKAHSTISRLLPFPSRSACLFLFSSSLTQCARSEYSPESPLSWIESRACRPSGSKNLAPSYLAECETLVRHRRPLPTPLIAPGPPRLLRRMLMTGIRNQACLVTRPRLCKVGLKAATALSMERGR
jgi:hypothetical protein